MSKKKAAEFLITIGNKVYKWVRGKDNPNKLRDVLDKGGKINTKPTPRQLANAKPFSAIPGAGSRAVPSRAQQAERATRATRSTSPTTAAKPKQASLAQSRALRTIRTAERTAKPKNTAVVPRGRTAPAAPPPRPPRPPRSSVPSAGRSGMTRGSTARLTPAQRLAILGKAGAAATQVMPKSEMPKAKAAPKPAPKKMPMPKPRPPVQGPPKGDPGYRPSKGGQVMPKRFDGTYSKDTQRLVNITVDGKRNTYEIPKGMSTAQATKLLTGSTKRQPETVKRKSGKKVAPSKYKGFSKLPEKVQKKMSPELAKKYKKGGKISKPKSEVVARQQRGWGCARKPKK